MRFSRSLFYTALLAAAADGFNYSFEVFLAVVVGDFLSGFDSPSRPNPDAATLRSEGFRVWLARMIDITGDVAARAAVNRPFCVYPKVVLAVAAFDYFVGNQWPEIFNDSLALGNRFEGDHAQARARFLDDEINILPHALNSTALSISQN